MPMFQLAACRQDQRVIRIRPFVGLYDAGGSKPAAAILPRKAVAEDDRLTRVIRAFARIGDRSFRLKPFPRDVVKRLHCHFHLGENLRRMFIVPGQAKPFGNFGRYPPILPRFSRRRCRRPPYLHLPVGVGHGAGLFREGRGRENNVRVVRGFRQENVLYNQVFEHLQSVAGMQNVGIRHGGVFAEYIHAADCAFMDRRNDFGHSESRDSGKVARIPDLRETGPDPVVLHGFVVRKIHRDQPRVRGSLDVVLAAQRVQPRSWPANLTAHQGQRDYATRIVGAVDMLGYAHAPEDYAGPRTGELAGHGSQCFGVDPADFRHLAGGELRQVRLLFFPVLGECLDILAVEEILLDDHIHDCIQHRHIGSRPELEHMGCMPAQFATPGIHYDQLAAPLGELLEIGRGDRVVFDGIGADDDGNVRVPDFVECRRHRARADIFHQRRN